jgi:nucleoside-diphosphate-sugar epimerase
MKILITGVAGFLGSHLCDKLLSEGHEVWGIDNFFRGKLENLPKHKNFKFLEIDLAQNGYDIENLDIVFHYAAINGTRYFYDIPNKVVDDNIRITQNVLKSITSSVTKIIYTSSSEIYGPKPAIPTIETQPIELHIDADRDSYASSKAIGEFMIKTFCKQKNISYLILRPFNTYGDRMATNGYGQVIPELIERLNEDTFFIYGDGTQTRSFCFVDDHVNIANILMTTADNEVLNIGYDEEVTIDELAKKILKLYKSDKMIETHPAWSNDTKWRKPSLDKLKKYIGEYQYVTLEEGLKILKNGRN